MEDTQATAEKVEVDVGFVRKVAEMAAKMMGRAQSAPRTERETAGASYDQAAVGLSLNEIDEYLKERPEHAENLLRLVDVEIGAREFKMRFLRLKELYAVRKYLLGRLP